MITRPFWITSNIAIVPRPRGGDWLEDEMQALRKAGIDAVVSMLEYPEAVELGLVGEEEAAQEAGVAFLNFAIPDRSVPLDVDLFRQFLDQLEEQLSGGKRIGIHCRACIGRSSVVVGSLLIRSGTPASKAWHQIESARGFPVPDTAEQREWVDQNIKMRPQ